MEAVMLSIKPFLPKLVGKNVLIRSDISTVVRYINKQTFSSVVHENLKTMAIGIRQSDVAESSTHCIEKEHFNRPSKQVPGPANRVDVEQKDSPKAVHNLGSSSYRSVCVSNKSSNTDLLLMESRPSRLCNRCSNNSMEQHVCLFISSNMSHSQESATHDTIQLSTDSHCPTSAKETLVSQSPKINSRLSEKVSIQRRSSTTAKIKHSSSKSSSIQSNCMALIDKHFKEKGFSKQTRKLLQASWRKGTQKDYSCKFRKFNSWCSRKEVDPYNASLTDAAEFLIIDQCYLQLCHP
jgi:hypothetical protein